MKDITSIFPTELVEKFYKLLPEIPDLTVSEEELTKESAKFGRLVIREGLTEEEMELVLLGQDLMKWKLQIHENFRCIRKSVVMAGCYLYKDPAQEGDWESYDNMIMFVQIGLNLLFHSWECVAQSANRFYGLGMSENEVSLTKVKAKLEEYNWVKEDIYKFISKFLLGKSGVYGFLKDIRHAGTHRFSRLINYEQYEKVNGKLQPIDMEKVAVDIHLITHMMIDQLELLKLGYKFADLAYEKAWGQAKKCFTIHEIPKEVLNKLASRKKRKR